MEIQQLFNGILLALSLSTIILTLITYIIFRVRQIPISRSKDDSDNKIQGVFFRRYVPSGFYLGPVGAGADLATSEKRFFWRSRTTTFFTIAFVTIFIAIVAQIYLSNTEFSSGRKLSAKNYKKLIEAGLMRTYEYASHDAEKALEEVVPENDVKRLDGILESLRSKKILFFSVDSNKKSLNPKTDAALSGWRQFLNAQSLKWGATSNPAFFRGADVVVLPQIQSLTDSQRAAIELALNSGTSFISTGPIGIRNGLGIVTDGSWAERIFGVKLINTTTQKGYFPSLFSRGAVPLWDIPPGLLLKMFPTDSDWQALSVRGGAVSFESTYTGDIHFQGGAAVSRIQLLGEGASRRAWLAFDPGEMKERSPAESFYQRAMFVSLLAWAAKVPMAQVSLWPEGHSFASVIAIDALDGFENTDRFIRLLRKTQNPATLFIDDRIYEESERYLNNIQSEVEFSLGYRNTFKRGEVMAERYFVLLQEARIGLEERSRQGIAGLHPLQETYDEQIVNAVEQNRFKYILGDDRIHRFAPVWIASGNLLSIPRVLDDDIKIDRRKDIVRPEQVTKIILQEIEQARRAGGVAVLNLHTSVFGQKVYIAPLEQALVALNQWEPWRASLKDLYRWWKAREALVVEIKKESTDSSHYLLTVKNSANTDVDGIVVRVDVGYPMSGDGTIRVGLLKAGEKKVLKF